MIQFISEDAAGDPTAIRLGVWEEGTPEVRVLSPREVTLAGIALRRDRWSLGIGDWVVWFQYLAKAGERPSIIFRRGWVKTIADGGESFRVCDVNGLEGTTGPSNCTRYTPTREELRLTASARLAAARDAGKAAEEVAQAGQEARPSCFGLFFGDRIVWTAGSAIEDGVAFGAVAVHGEVKGWRMINDGKAPGAFQIVAAPDSSPNSRVLLDHGQWVREEEDGA